MLSPLPRVAWFAVNLPLAAGLGWLMSKAGAQQSYADALVTAMSVTGQILMTHKLVENWALWILVNALYAFYILPTQHLWVSAGLYVVLLVLAIQGLVGWRRIRSGPTSGAEERRAAT